MVISADGLTPLLTKFRDAGSWSDGELGLLKSLESRRRRFEAHHTIVHEGDPAIELFLIQEGWTCVHKVLSTGARQIIAFPLPGDVVGLSDIMAGRATGSLESLTEVVVSPIPTALVRDMLTLSTPVGRMLSRCLEQTNAITVEHLVNTGRRSALARTAHLFLEFASRLKLIGVSVDAGFELPINQTCIADALGMTPIHTNRILRQLREAHLMTLKSGVVEIHNWSALADVASFSADYLSIDPVGSRRPSGAQRTQQSY